MKGIDTIFFDNWNTLVQAPNLMKRGSSAKIFHSYLTSQGLSVPYDKFVEAYVIVSRRQIQEADDKGFLELDYEGRLRTVFTQFSLEDVANLASGAWRSYLDEWPRQTVFFPETRGVLEQLKGRYKMGVITNYMHGPTCRVVFNKLGYGELFDSLIVSAEVGFRKPSKVIFERALKETGSDPSGSVMVGDMYQADIVGANMMGMRSVLVDIYSNQHQHYIEASRVIRSIEELPMAIESLVKAS